MTKLPLRRSVAISIALCCLRLSHGFTIGEVSSHLPLLSANQIGTSTVFSDVPGSLLSTAAFVPALRPQQLGVTLFNEYQALLAVHPLSTKLVTGAILAVAGDAVAQGRDRGDYNPSRGVSFAAFDVTYRAVQNHIFPIIVENFQGRYFLSAVEAIGLMQIFGNIDVLAAMERALVNQLIVVPFFYYPVFFLFSGIQLGLTYEEGLDRAKENFLPLMKRNLLFWVPIQYAQFAFVPLDLQIPFLCLAGLIWTYILSILAGSSKKYSNEPSESDEVYCLTMTENVCVLPDDELIPIPDMISSTEEKEEETDWMEEEEMLPETVMMDNFEEASRSKDLSRNSTEAEVLVR